MKAPVRFQTQPGQAGSVLLAHDTQTGNASPLRLAKLRDVGFAPEQAKLLAPFIWGGADV